MALALVVEDDINTLNLFDAALQTAGFKVLTAGGVGEAIALLTKQTPDIAFVDMNLPERPGSDVLAFIRSTPRLGKCKTVVVTGNGRSDALATHYEADLFMVKPVDIPEMIRLAQRLTR